LVSSDCIDLIAQLLEKDKNKRISATKALDHKWMDSVNIEIHNDMVISDEILKKSVENFKN